jgi:hypothetical protein
MTDPSGYAKTLALPAGFDAPRLRRYDDVAAHAITRDDLGADVRGFSAGSAPASRHARSLAFDGGQGTGGRSICRRAGAPMRADDEEQQVPDEEQAAPYLLPMRLPGAANRRDSVRAVSHQGTRKAAAHTPNFAVVRSGLIEWRRWESNPRPQPREGRRLRA